MKLGLCIEASSKLKIPDVERVLNSAGYEPINFGMSNTDEGPQLTYMHTGFLTALFLNLGIVDFVVGGCGTGQGYMNAVLQYPGTACGLLFDPTDAWLFSQINGGNCISLPYNKGYGVLGGDIMVSHIIEKLFKDPSGMGYPPHRAEIQKEARKKLSQLSADSHYTMEEILQRINKELIATSLHFPGIVEMIQQAPESSLKNAVLIMAENTK